MIARDEAENLAVCLESVVKHVDEIIVVDTGSRDATRAVALRFGARVVDWNPQTQPDQFFVDDEATCRKFDAPGPYSGMIALGNFAGARNAGFELATGDYVLWLDSDDVLIGGEHLRACVAELAAKNLDMGFMAYDYAHDELGRVRFRHWRERVIKRGAATWVNPIHEVLLPLPGRGSKIDFQNVRVAHRRKGDRTVVPNRNYKNLLRELKRQTDAGDVIDPRLYFYLGQEARGPEPLRALEFYSKYLTVSHWSEERAQAHLMMGFLYENGAIPLPIEDLRQCAYDKFAVAAIESPNNPDGLFGMARISQVRGQFLDCVVFTERALAIGNTESLLGTDPTGRGYLPHLFYNYALNKLGRIEDAAASCRRGLEACPEDPGGPYNLKPGTLRANLKVYENFLRSQRQDGPQLRPGEMVVTKEENLLAAPQQIPPDPLCTWSIQLWKQAFYVERDVAKASRLLDALPASIAHVSVVGQMRRITDVARDGQPQVPARSLPPIDLGDHAGTDKKLVLWIGQNIEDWGPETPDTTGIGGSETAAINVCRVLAERGWDVTVYGCPPVEGTFDGVRYVRWERFAGCDVDVFVSSRDYAPVLRDDVRARAKFLWVHDTSVGIHSAELERALLRFDRVLCLSNWHKADFCRSYPTLHPDRVVVTRNGVDLERFAAFDLDRQRPNRLIWASSPPRRLDIALGNLKYVRERVPDAELHIYYGFETWEKFARGRNDPGELAQIQAFRDLIQATPGAVYHGRVNQRELAEAFLESKVWAYQTDFTETSCITAMEAQAAGCVPVVSRVAALAETVRSGTLIDNVEGSGQRFIDEIVRLMSDRYYWRDQAGAARQAAQAFSWDRVVDEWVQMFADVAADAATNPVHPWRRAA